MNPVDILLLLSELEGSSAHCRRLNFLEDASVLDEMKGRYYKLYFKLKKDSNAKDG
jgi:hypothetical protein